MTTEEIKQQEEIDKWWAEQMKEWNKQFADDPEHPCYDCHCMCDGWEARYCCQLCTYMGHGEYSEIDDYYCEDCNREDL